MLDPEDLHEVCIAYENLCAAVPENLLTPKLRACIARQVLVLARLHGCDATDLYLRCMRTTTFQISVMVSKSIALQAS